MGNSSGKSDNLSYASNVSHSHPELEVFTTGNLPTILSTLAIAVVNNNVGLLKSLLKIGVCINTRDYEGNTLIHVAVINESLDVFNFLTSRDDIDIDAANFHGFSALTMAALHDKVDYVVKLIEKGADVNVVDKSGSTPLHYACHYGSKKLCQILLRNGSNVNARNVTGETPLHIACQYGSPEIIYMLLYYNADTSVSCKKGIIPLLVKRVNTLEMQLRVTLYYYTFDDQSACMELKTVVRAMVFKWPLFPEMLSKISNVTYDKFALELLNDSLPDMEPDNFRKFFDKFHYIVKDMLLHCCTLTNYLTSVEGMKRASPEFVDLLYILLESNLVSDVIQSRCSSVSPVYSLIKIFHKNNLPIKTLTELVCHMLSYGLTVTPEDLNAVYVFYGRCDLFEIMLHMDIDSLNEGSPCCSLYDCEVVQKSILPHFIYDVNLDIGKFLENPHSYLLMDLYVLLDYFALPKLKEFFLEDGAPSHKVSDKLKRLPSVPCLIELARNVARNHIINRFGIKNSSQFYTVIRWLPINDVYKKILSFEKKLYLD